MRDCLPTFVRGFSKPLVPEILTRFVYTGLAYKYHNNGVNKSEQSGIPQALQTVCATSNPNTCDVNCNMLPVQAAPATEVTKPGRKTKKTCARCRRIEVETPHLNFISSRPNSNQIAASNPKTSSVIPIFTPTTPPFQRLRITSGVSLHARHRGIATHAPSPFPSVPAPLCATQEIAQLSAHRAYHDIAAPTYRGNKSLPRPTLCNSRDRPTIQPTTLTMTLPRQLTAGTSSSYAELTTSRPGIWTSHRNPKIPSTTSRKRRGQYIYII